MTNRMGRLPALLVLCAPLAPRIGPAAPIEEGHFTAINGTEQWITISTHVGTAQSVSGTLERLGQPPGATLEDVLVHAQHVNQPGTTAMAALANVAPVLFAPPPPDATCAPRGLPAIDPFADATWGR